MTFLKLFSNSEQSKIKAINERLDALDSQIRLLRLEWTEVYDKVTHAVERWSKRQKAEKQPELEKTTIETASPENRQYTDAELMALARKQGMVP